MTREISYEQDGRGGGGDDDDDRIYNESSAWSLGITQPPPRARLRRQEIVSMVSLFLPLDSISEGDPCFPNLGPSVQC